MYEDYRPRLRVDLGAIRRNVRALRTKRPGSEVIPVVKADCYGLGARHIVPALREEGCTSFYVSYPSEAADLQGVCPDAIFYILNAGPGSGPYTDQLRPVFYRVQDLVNWRGGPCGFQVDIGMNRIGEAIAAVRNLGAQESVTLFVGHMSDAGDPASPRNEEQRELFAQLREELRQVFPNAAFSLSATGGLLLDGNVDEQAVRPGMGLYGGKAGALGPLEPAACFEARVLSVFDVPEGAAVGYSGLWHAPRPSRCATLSVGYADGLPRSLTGHGSVHLGGVLCPLAGAVSMDLATVDVTDAGDVKAGDWAQLFGPELPLDTVASQAGLIGYELLTMIRGRTLRLYRDSERKRSTSS